MGPATLVLFIAESIFEANAVRPPPGIRYVDVTVRLDTGAFVIEPDEELGKVNGGYGGLTQFVPIWRIDDGPVYGISWERCQTAKRLSMTAVSRGFPASWPGDLPCANASYSGPWSSYSHVVSLATGLHTLWTGLVVEVRYGHSRRSLRDPQRYLLLSVGKPGRRLASGVDRARGHRRPSFSVC